jgi:hypothetical protein
MSGKTLTSATYSTYCINRAIFYSRNIGVNHISEEGGNGKIK